MARRVHIVLEDDLDGGPADETVVFGLDGREYEIDLSAQRAESLRDALEPYISAGRRRTSGKKKERSGTRKSGSRSDLAQIREWARTNGVEVSKRGRISASVIEKYDAAVGKLTKLG